MYTIVHGTATLIEDMRDKEGNIIRHAGEVGIITAYLPSNNKFSVMFDSRMDANSWFTFDKFSFDKFFQYTLNKEV